MAQKADQEKQPAAKKDEKPVTVQKDKFDKDHRPTGSVGLEIKAEPEDGRFVVQDVPRDLLEKSEPLVSGGLSVRCRAIQKTFRLTNRFGAVAIM